MAFHYFSEKDRYPMSGANCSKPEISLQEQSKEQFQPKFSASTNQVQIVEDSPDSTKQSDSDHLKACSSIQEGNEGSNFAQDLQQLIVSADELPKKGESTGGDRNSCTDTESIQKSATTTCKEKKNADGTKPKEKSATVEVLAATQLDDDQGIALRCKCLLLEVKCVPGVHHRLQVCPHFIKPL